MLAPAWVRAASRTIDLAILAPLLVGFIYLLHRLDSNLGLVVDFAILFVIILYEVLVPYFSKGRSLGRLMTGTRLVKESDHALPSLVQCASRVLCRVAIWSIFVVLVAYEIDVFP
jgi:uncharacterized RDD family membrane protein YckC